MDIALDKNGENVSTDLDDKNRFSWNHHSKVEKKCCKTRKINFLFFIIEIGVMMIFIS